MNNIDIETLLDGTATIETKIEILNSRGEVETTLTNEDSVKTWELSDLRYVPDAGFLGKFVERNLEGTLQNISENFNIENREIVLYLGMRRYVDNYTDADLEVTGNVHSIIHGVDSKLGSYITTFYSLGNFIVDKPSDDEVKDNTRYTAKDYTIKFNIAFNGDYTSVEFPKSFNTLLNENGSVTAEWLARYTCNQAGVELGSTDFVNNNFRIPSNQFDSGDQCRDVMKYIGKLAYSWVRVDWDNKVYIDFKVKKTVDLEYNNITKDDYYTLETQKETYGAINKVALGSSIVEGLYSYVEDSASVATNGEKILVINDNPILYTDELRNEAVKTGNVLFGLTYTPIVTETTGHPWLKGNELISIVTSDDSVIYSYPFDRILKYNGHIRTEIASYAPTKVEEDYNYTGTGTASNQFKYTRVLLDRNTQMLTSYMEKTDNNSSQISSFEQNLEGAVVRVTNVEKGLNTTNTNLETTNKNVTNLQTQINGVSADFEDFKDNEYVQSINNLQSQIDGAIQFWNGADIPTLNNYPAINWKTEADKVNHQADIYTVIKDVSGELKQGKAYRFDKVNGVWQWIELTDNELSAVQALAQEALNKANTNTSDIKVLKQTDTEIKADINGINLKYDTLNNDYQANLTTRKSVSGNPVYIPDSGGYPLEEDIIRGKTIQEAILPSGYSQVEYLQSNANQYIDTGFKPNQDTKIDITFESIQPTNEYYNAPFGVRDTNNSKQMFIGLQTGVTDKTWFFRYGTQATTTALGNKYGYNHLVIDKNVYTLNGGVITFTYEEFQSEYSMYLFGYNYNGTQDRLFTGKILACKIYDNGQLVRDYVPCRRDSDNVLGMYDLVNNTFNENKTATAFTRGAVVTVSTPQFPREMINNRGIENLIDIPKGTQIRNGVEVSVDDDYVITLNGTCTTDKTTFKFNNEGKDNFLDGIYTLHYQYISGSISGNTSTCAIQIQETTTWKGLLVKLYNYNNQLTNTLNNNNYRAWNIRFDNGVVFDNYKIKVQLVKGNKKRSIVPYGSNYLVQKIGDKNLFDKIGKYSWTANGSATYEKIDDYIKVTMPSSPQSASGIFATNYGADAEPMLNILRNLKGKDFVYSFYAKADANRTIRYQFGDAVRRVINLTTEWQRFSLKLTTNETQVPTFYCGDSLSTTPYYIKNIMVEYGKELSEYEDKKTNQVLFDLQGNELCELDNIKDEVDFTTGSFTKKLYGFTLDGTQEINGVDTSQKNTTRIFFSNILPYVCDSSRALLVCNRLKKVVMWANDLEGIYLDGGKKNVIVRVNKAVIGTTKEEINAWLKENPIRFIYELAEPQTIQLDSVEVELFEGVNNVYTESNVDLDDVDIVYLTDSVLNSQYATRSEVKLAEDRIQTEVSSKTTILETGLTLANNKIDTTNVNLQNQITATNESLGNYATNASVVSIQNTVSTINTSLQSQILITKDIQENGVSKVKTATGFTFDENGLTIDKTGAVTKTNIDEDGMVVYSTSGAETEMLKADSTGVVAENLTSRKYFVCGSKSRFEDYSDGTGCFYIG